jgi:transcription antitermination factor NusG
VVHRGKLTLRVQPLFPGYIFIIAKYLFQLIERLTGVRGFVRFGGSIEDIPDAVVHGLRARAGVTGILDEDRLPFAVGQRVSLRVGGQDAVGVFREYAGPSRAVVDVAMMGRSCCVRARLGELRALD